MKKIRLGIVSAGAIVARVMKDMHLLENVEITAIAARDLERAQAAAEQYHIPHAYGSYLELAQSSEVDLAYIATPHTFHAEQAMLMMRHGKHVICEKPMAINQNEVQQMIDCARENGVFLMEAMWTRFQPCVKTLIRMLHDGVIGEVRNIFGEFSWSCQDSYDPSSRLFDPALAGGALLDLGVYPLMFCMQVLGDEPETIQSLCRKTPEGVDMNTSVQMQYQNGAIAQFFCGMDACSNDYMQIYGTKGHIVLPGFWRADRFTICREGQEDQLLTFDLPNEPYHYEFDHATACIQQGLLESPVMPLAESYKVSKLCTEIRHKHGIVYPGEVGE
ncbi:MAG: Gfo/Idh/MocA family oxidoreductase [Clostridia bacterium]|nr:Gfo/Idh/MocA family oxidoreductase [Clostridia bacterium]